MGTTQTLSRCKQVFLCPSYPYIGHTHAERAPLLFGRHNYHWTTTLTLSRARQSSLPPPPPPHPNRRAHPVTSITLGKYFFHTVTPFRWATSSHPGVPRALSALS